MIVMYLYSMTGIAQCSGNDMITQITVKKEDEIVRLQL